MSEMPGKSASTLAPKAWSAEDEISIPTTDIVSYVFEKYKDYGPDTKVFVEASDTSKFWTAGAARDRVRMLVQGIFALQDYHVGDTVCIHSYNNIDYPLLWLGIVGAGGCVAGSNPAYTAAELVHFLTTTRAKFIISHIDCLPAILEAAAQLPKAEHEKESFFEESIYDGKIYVFGCPRDNVRFPLQSWEELLDFRSPKYGTDWKTYEENDLGDVVALLGMTSGTTGVAKAAAISHRALVAQCEIQLKYKGKPSYKPSRLICLPLFHAFALPLGVLFPLREGITTYLLPRFRVKNFADAVHTLSITETAVVPPIVALLLEHAPVHDRCLRSLQYVLCAGSCMNPLVQLKLYEVLDSSATIAQLWGMTELGPASTFRLDERDDSGSVGRLLPNVELKIVNPLGQIITEEGKPGEAYLRSPGLFKGYRDNPQATANAFDVDGFYRTGDRVFMKGGKVFIDGRMKDIMKVKGWQVSPAELESILLQHPAVADVAVIGLIVYHTDAIEEVLPKAFVIRKIRKAKARIDSVGGGGGGGESEVEVPYLVDEEELVEFVAGKVVSYKRLTGGVEFIEEIPRSSAGKVLRRTFYEGEEFLSAKLEGVSLEKA